MLSVGILSGGFLYFISKRGLAPLVVADIFRIIREINQEGVTILQVEQNVRQALKVAPHYAYVMETGKIILHGKAEEIAHNPRVVEAYLR